MANFGPTVWYCRDNAPTSTIGWSAVAAWATGTVTAAGKLIRQLATPAVGSERVFAAIIAGTTHASTEPTWVITKGAKTTDNTVTWMEVTGQPGVNGDLTNCPTWLQNKNTVITLGLIVQRGSAASLQICTTAGTTGNSAEPAFSNTAGVTTSDNTVTWTSLGAVGNFGAWAAPFARQQTAVTWMAAGHTCYVGDDHAETQAAAETITSPGTPASPCLFYCVDHTVAVPPGSANLKTTATVTTTGLNNMTLQGGVYYYGIIFSCGTGANAPILSVVGTWMRFDSCALRNLGTTSGGNSINLQGTVIELNNTTIQAASTGLQIRISGDVKWKNTPGAITGATIPTVLFGPNGVAGVLIFEGVDLSALASGKTIFSGAAYVQRIHLIDCKLGSSVTVTTAPTGPGFRVDVARSDSAGTDYQAQSYQYSGTLLTETTIIRTGGASDGTTRVSWNLTTRANSEWVLPFETPPIAVWNPTTAANVTLTLHGIVNAATVPNNDDLWIEVAYLGSAASPQASFANNTKANNLAAGSALAADSTSAWDSRVTARGDTTAYVVGNTIKVASNPGRVFWCTSAGTSAGSEPGVYATAVDGGSVTDNGAVFRAGCRFTLAVTLSSPQPALAGYLRAVVKAAKISTTWYVDPLIVLS